MLRPKNNNHPAILPHLLPSLIKEVESFMVDYQYDSTKATGWLVEAMVSLQNDPVRCDDYTREEAPYALTGLLTFILKLQEIYNQSKVSPN